MRQIVTLQLLFYLLCANNSYSAEKQMPSGQHDGNWQEVRITGKQEVNALYAEGCIRRYDFDGNLIAAQACEKYLSADVDDEAWYLKTDNSTVAKYPLNGNQKSLLKTKEPIASFFPNAIITTDRYLTLYDDEANPYWPVKVDTDYNEWSRLDSGEIILFNSETGSLALHDNYRTTRIFELKKRIIKDILGYKVSPNKIIITWQGAETKRNTTRLSVLNIENRTVDCSFYAPFKITLTAINRTHLAVDGTKEDQLRVYDLERAQEIYSGNNPVGGICHMRLNDNGTIYAVGNKPSPQVVAIDTRQKSSYNS